LNTAVTCLNWQAWGGKEGRGRGGAERIPRRAAAAGAGARKKKRKGGLEADRWGPPVGAAEKKKEKGRREVGRLGCLGQKGKGASFLFFSFPFSNLIFKTILNSNPFQTFANFSQIFYRLLRDYSSNQNHASQMMMHIHLLFLSLLYHL
jgi:hypothetical protein